MSLLRRHLDLPAYVRESAGHDIELSRARTCPGLRNKIGPTCRYAKSCTSTWTRFMRRWNSGTIRNCASPSLSRGAAADPSSVPLLMKRDDLACGPQCQQFERNTSFGTSPTTDTTTITTMPPATTDLITPYTTELPHYAN